MRGDGRDGRMISAPTGLVVRDVEDAVPYEGGQGNEK